MWKRAQGCFEPNIHDIKNNRVLFVAQMERNVYTMDFDDLAKHKIKCFASTK